MEWVNILDYCPDKDDAECLVCHEKLNLSPIRAYFDLEEKMFFPLDSTQSYPLLITHWIPLPYSLHQLKLIVRKENFR